MFRLHAVCAAFLIAVSCALAFPAAAQDQWVLAITNPGPQSGAGGGALEALVDPSTGTLHLRYGASGGGATSTGTWPALRYGGFPGDFVGAWDTSAPANGIAGQTSLEIESAPRIPNVDIDIYSISWPNGDVGWLTGDYTYAVGAWNAGALGSIYLPGDGTAGIALFVPDENGLAFFQELEWQAYSVAGTYQFTASDGSTGTITLAPADNLMNVTINAPSGTLTGVAMQMVPVR
jgi:hypothetical protein